MALEQIREERRLRKFGSSTKEKVMDFIEGVDDEG